MTAPQYDIVLPPQRRGAEFRYSSTLLNSWVYTQFDGGVLFTLRTRIPASSVVDDTDALAQVSLASGGVIFTSPAAFTVLIPGAVTTAWPVQRLYWDMQGIVLASPEDRVFDIAAGTIIITGDVTRTQ